MQKKRQKTESEIPEGALSGKKKWRKCLERVLVILAFLLCFGTVAYPILSNYLSEKENSQLILDYQKEVEDRSEEEYEAELAARISRSPRPSRKAETDPFLFSVQTFRFGI